MAKTETCLRIVDALDEAMRTTSIDRVKVTQLCHASGVARATFYESFHDVYAVATWMWDHLMDDTLYQAGLRYDCREAHLRKFQVLRQYREFFGNAMRITGYESICQHGGRMMGEHIEEVFTAKTGRGFTPTEALEVEFYNTGAKHMTRHWVERGMVEEPDAMADLFTKNVPEFVLPYLDADPALALRFALRDPRSQ